MKAAPSHRQSFMPPSASSGSAGVLDHADARALAGRLDRDLDRRAAVAVVLQVNTHRCGALHLDHGAVPLRRRRSRITHPPPSTRSSSTSGASQLLQLARLGDHPPGLLLLQRQVVSPFHALLVHRVLPT